MTTELPENIRSRIERGVSILKEGGVIAYPTDTVYGLGASAAIPEAIERIYNIKQRSPNNPLPLLVASIDQIKELAGPLPGTAEELIETFMPGGLTLVLKTTGPVPDIITSGGGTVALRIPAHPVPLALIEGLGGPIIGTSANLSGRHTPLTANRVKEQLGERLDFIIDGGKCTGGKESTIIDVTESPPVILRRGAIPFGKIREIIPDVYFKEEN